MLFMMTLSHDNNQPRMATSGGGVVPREMWKEGTTAGVTILLYSKLIIAHFINLSLNDYILDYATSALVASIVAMGVTACKDGARKRQRG
jgi:hypothetical protein